MLRVCGVTFTHTVNYGSFWQSYALQEVVKAQEIEGEKCTYSQIPVRKLKGGPHDGLKRRIIFMILDWYYLSFRPFAQKKLCYAACRSVADLPEMNRQADAFVCGSDVIWNPDENHRQGLFYLDFARKYAFSYAASFGKTNLSEKDMAFAGKKLAALRQISVREESGAEMVSRCTDRQARIVSDPVLLLKREQWDHVAAAPRTRKPYIFVYHTHAGKNLSDFIEKLRQQTGLEVVTAVGFPKQALKKGRLWMYGPQRWLQLLRDAEYVVTNSFHATAFSNIFHKKFFVVVNGERDKGINIRMYNLLKNLGLLERLFSTPPEKIDTSEIDFTQADEKIAAMREESLAYLRENLEAAYAEKITLEKKEN